MKIFTIQPKPVFEQLMDIGHYYTKEELIEADWLKWNRCGYQWMIERLSEKSNKPEYCAFPVWGWYNKKAFVGSNYFKNYTDDNRYVIEINIPQKNVLLSDFIRWGLVLSGDFWSEKYIKEDRELIKDGEFYDFWYGEIEFSLDKYEHYKIKHKKLFDNWKTIFRIDRNEYVQATFWEIFKKQVVKYKIIN